MMFQDLRKKVCKEKEIPTLCSIYDRITDTKATIRALNDLSQSSSVSNMRSQIAAMKEKLGVKLTKLMEQAKKELEK